MVYGSHYLYTQLFYDISGIKTGKKSTFIQNIYVINI